MKKLIIFVLLMGLMAACTNKPAQGDNETAGPYDSLTVQIDSIGVMMTLKTDVPTQDTLLHRSLAQFVADNMFYTEDEEGNVVRPEYQGDIRAFLKTCAQQKWSEVENATYEGFPETLADDDEGLTRADMREQAVADSMALSDCNIMVRLTDDNDSLATWQFDILVNIYNTAHPSTRTETITLRKADGLPAACITLR